MFANFGLYAAFLGTSLALLVDALLASALG